MGMRWAFYLSMGLLGLGPAAEAFDFVYQEASPFRARLDPKDLSVSSSEGYWVLGTANEDGVVAHYAQDGALLSMQFGVQHSSIKALTDGGAITAGTEGFSSPRCTARRYSPDGILRWTSSLPPSRCYAFYPGAAGAAWWVTANQPNEPEAVYRVSADGRVSAITVGAVISQSEFTVFASDPSRGQFYAGGAIATGFNQFEKGAVAALDESGTVLWVRSLAAGDARLNQLTLGHDGHIYASGSITAPDGNQILFTASVAADGTERWRVQDHSVGYTTQVLEAAADEGAYLLIDGDTAAELRRIGANGSILWRRDLDAESICGDGTVCRLRVGPSGGVVALVYRRQPNARPELQLRRFDANGNSVAVSSAGTVEARAAVMLADESVLLTTITQTYDPVFFTSYLYGYARYGRNGESLPVPATENATDSDSRLLAQATGTDGTSYLFSADVAGERTTLSGVDANGQRVWLQTGTGNWPALAAISTAGDRVCVAGQRVTNAPFESVIVIDCRSRTLGERLWTKTLDRNSQIARLSALRVLDDGRVAAIWLGNGINPGTHHVVLDGEGALQTDYVNARTDLFASSIATDGSAALVFGFTSSRVVALDAQSRLRFDVALDPSDLSPRGINAQGDGSLAIIGERRESNGSYATYARRLAADGSPLWLTLLGPIAQPSGGLEIVGDDFYYALGCCTLFVGDTPTGVAPMLVGRLDWRNGNPIWQRTLPRSYFGLPSLARDAVHNALIVTSGWRTARIRLFALDSDTGAARIDRFESCSATSCGIFGTRVLANGDLRLVASTESPASGDQSRIFGVAAVGQARAPLRLDQTGIRGTWYAPYSTGQGWVIDYFPHNGTVFAPWFTFTASAANDPREQRWYAMQGTAALTARSVELDIVESSAGAFDSGPPPVATRVGSAELSFDDCDRGSLRYRFEPGHNGGAEGLVSLQRITPAHDDCIRADGSVRPASAPAASGGFDTRQAGSWYDPDTAGQGLMLALRPGAWLYAAWFTYDPVGYVGASNRQHWFTLQGDLGAASNGSAALSIIQTLGGTFDALPTNNGTIVGSAQLSMLACDRARLDYRFADTEPAIPFRNLSGSIELVKIGGCASP